MYARVSTREQAEQGFNLREQVRTVKSYISVFQSDYSNEIEVYVDDGYSAKNLNRKEMNRLIKDIKNGEIAKVVIHNLDRLTRRVKDLIRIIELFDEHDVELVSIKEKVETKTAMGRFFIMIIILIAQWEQETNSERTKRGLDQSATEGNYAKGRLAPFGYKKIDNRLTIDYNQSKIVKAIFMMYVNDRRSMEYIAHFLNSTSSNNRRWDMDKVRTILTNSIYYGNFNNNRVNIDGHSPSIIDEKDFRTAQLLLIVETLEKSTHIYLKVCVIVLQLEKD